MKNWDDILNNFKKANEEEKEAILIIRGEKLRTVWMDEIAEPVNQNFKKDEE